MRKLCVGKKGFTIFLRFFITSLNKIKKNYFTTTNYDTFVTDDILQPKTVG